MKARLVSLIVIIFIFLSGCKEDKSSDVVEGEIVIPLFSECTEFVSSYLNKTPKSVGLSYKVVEFDYVPRAVPSIVGYVEIKSLKQNKEQLMSVANSFILACYPESKTTIEKHQNDAGDMLLNALQVNSRATNNKNYIVDDGDKVHIYINRN